MGKRQLLFVTYRDENIEEGGAYAIELAKAMFEDIVLLLVQKKGRLLNRLGNLMTAASFAEAGEFDTARDINAQGVIPEEYTADTVGNLMSAIAFAEEGEPEIARGMLAEDSVYVRKSFDERLADLVAACTKEGIQVMIEDSKLDAVAGTRAFLKNHGGIDKVVLSPAVTGDGNLSAKELNRLVRTSSRPIVTMTRQACCTV